MRELKFRAWDRIKRKMLYGVSPFNVHITDENEPLLSLEYSKHDDCEFEQYTGLKDKNGKEIYEGDIVERRKLISAREMAVPGWGKDHTEIRRAVIVYKHGMFYGRSITIGINTNYSWDELEADFEIIGNIHENTELLEEEEWATD